jgi:hypothetical protein
MDRQNDTGQAARQFYEKRRRWLDFLSTDSRVSHADFRVAYFIASRMNGDKQSSWWKVKAIAQQSGCSVRSVIYATANLEKLDLLIVVRPKRGINEYSIKMPYETKDI